MNNQELIRRYQAQRQSRRTVEGVWNEITRYVFLAFVYGLTFLAVLTRSRNDADTTMIDLSLFLMCALIVSPVSWTHHHPLLLLPFALCLGNKPSF